LYKYYFTRSVSPDPEHINGIISKWRLCFILEDVE